MRKRTKVVFLGTSGGRVTTFRLIRRSGGFLIDWGNSKVHVDPGPGAFVYLKEKGIDYRTVDLIVLSHIHLDHTADVNTLIEACTDGGKHRNLSLFAPRSAVEGRERVVLPYLIDRLSFLGIMEEGKEFEYREIKVKPVMKHTHHGVENYSLLFNDSIVYLPCAKFEERMFEIYPKGLELMIVSTTFYRKRPHIDHLSVEEVRELISVCRPKRTVLTHFSVEMHEMNPRRVADELSHDLGLEVLAAEDGMELEF